MARNAASLSEVFDSHSRNELEDPFSHFFPVAEYSSSARACSPLFVLSRILPLYLLLAPPCALLFALHFLPLPHAGSNLALIEILPKRVLDEFIQIPPDLARSAARRSGRPLR